MFTIEGATPWVELKRQVRDTPLLYPRNGQKVYPYAKAGISLKPVSFAEVRPTSLYVLRKNLATQTAIATALAKEGYDPLELRAGLTIHDSETRWSTALVPPIVEQTDADGMYVLDGAHRTSLGRWKGKSEFLAIVISGIREDCPSYALPNEWDGADGIRLVETVPENPADKKHYREQPESFYRDFSRLGSSGLRGSGL